MQLRDFDDLDELLRVIDRSGLCRVRRQPSAVRFICPIDSPITVKKERVEDASSRHHGDGSEVLSSRH